MGATTQALHDFVRHPRPSRTARLDDVRARAADEALDAPLLAAARDRGTPRSPRSSPPTASPRRPSSTPGAGRAPSTRSLRRAARRCAAGSTRRPGYRSSSSTPPSWSSSPSRAARHSSRDAVLPSVNRLNRTALSTPRWPPISCCRRPASRSAATSTSWSGELLVEQNETVIRWAEWAERQVNGWPDDIALPEGPRVGEFLRAASTPPAVNSHDARTPST